MTHVPRLPVLALATLAALAPLARAQAPAPAPELDQLKYFGGKWKCAGKQVATPLFGKERAVSGSAQSRPEADGQWLAFAYEEAKTKDHPGIKITGLWGYDRGGKRFVRAAASNQGTWDIGTSVGWEGDKMLWTGELSGPAGRLAFKHTFLRKGEKEWTHTLEVNHQGAWIPVSEVTCRR